MNSTAGPPPAYPSLNQTIQASRRALYPSAASTFMPAEDLHRPGYPRASTSEALSSHTPSAASHRSPNFSAYAGATGTDTAADAVSEKTQPRPSSTNRPVSPARPRYPPVPTTIREGGGEEDGAEIGGACGFFLRLPPKVRLWLSFGAWIATTVGVFIAIAFWRTEVFTGLDNLSLWLVKEGFKGYLIMFSLIVLTTVPPFPLYSTLMMLAGYTWGTWTGFAISYTSSLFGAILVYYISRRFFGSSLTALIKHMPTFARTVRAISRNPKLLFLVRLAPYPYNMMNVLLAACPGLRWRTYIGCTAFSLLKVVVHTSIGSGIRSFKGYYGVDGGDGKGTTPGGGAHFPGGGGRHDTPSEVRSREIAKWSTIIGVVLCVLILVYLGHVTRKAVDVELEDEEGGNPNPNPNLANTNTDMVLPLHNRRHSGHQRGETGAATSEERAAFLVHGPEDSDEEEEEGIAMSEARLAHGTRPGDRR